MRVRKNKLVLKFVNSFLSVKGIKNNPIKIIKGSFTESHIGIYVGGKFFENMHFPRVRVQTSLKCLLIELTASIINKGFFQYTGFNEQVNNNKKIKKAKIFLKFIFIKCNKFIFFKFMYRKKVNIYCVKINKPEILIDNNKAVKIDITNIEL